MRKIIILLCGWLLMLVLIPAVIADKDKKDTKPAQESEDGEDEDEPATPKKDQPAKNTTTPQEILKKASESYYAPEDQGVSRYACYVKVPEIAKAQQFRSSFILTNVNYEYIWEPNKPVQVKARDLPPYFGPEARLESEVYAGLMEKSLRELNGVIFPIKLLFKLIEDDGDKKYEMSSAVEGKLTRIDMTPKKKADREEPKEPANEGGEAKEGKEPGKKEKEAKENPPASETATVVIWLNKDYQITSFEYATKWERVQIVIAPVKYKKFWNMGKLDVTKKNAKDEFVERTIITYSYGFPKNIMLPSNICLTKADKSGKPLQRRNETNPININFTDYEVEAGK